MLDIKIPQLFKLGW